MCGLFKYVLSRCSACVCCCTDPGAGGFIRLVIDGCDCRKEVIRQDVSCRPTPVWPVCNSAVVFHHASPALHLAVGARAGNPCAIIHEQWNPNAPREVPCAQVVLTVVLSLICLLPALLAACFFAECLPLSPYKAPEQRLPTAVASPVPAPAAAQPAPAAVAPGA